MYFLLFAAFNLGVLTQAAPALLSATGLYQDIESKSLAKTVRHYVPQYPLWSDGSSKQRWIQLPPNSQIQTDGTQPWNGTPDHWLFPVGTKIWKEFSFYDSRRKGLKRVETRYLEKLSEGDWSLGSYVWNEDESEAALVSDDGMKGVFPTSPTTKHDIPSVMECLRCHKRGGDPVLGFDAIQLSNERDPLALHLEPLSSDSLTLRELIEKRVLSYNAPDFKQGLAKIQGRNANERVVLGYLHSNCSSCHNSLGNSSHVGMDLRHTLKAASPLEEPGLKNVVDKFTLVFNFPGMQKTYRVKSGDPEQSALYKMMALPAPSHMPPLGTTILDDSAVKLIRDWIQNL